MVTLENPAGKKNSFTFGFGGGANGGTLYHVNRDVSFMEIPVLSPSSSSPTGANRKTSSASSAAVRLLRNASMYGRVRTSTRYPATNGAAANGGNTYNLGLTHFI